MTTTTFVDGVTPVVASWLNDVNTATYTTVPAIPGKNAVINGAGIIQQRAAPTLTAVLQYGAADRHLIGVTSGTSISGTVGVLSNIGFSNGVGYGAIAASWTTGQFIHKHRIEGANTKRFNSKTVTVSGNLYQDTGGSRSFTISIGKPTTTLDTFSAVTNLGTSSSVPVASDTVTPFSYTLALGSTDASLGLQIQITDNAANTISSKNYAVSDLQLEIGSRASTFEQRLYGAELVLCQRYYEKSINTTEHVFSGNVTNSTFYYTSIKFSVTKRAPPSVTWIEGGVYGFAANTISAAETPSITGVFIEMAATSTITGAYYRFGFIAACEL